MKKVLIPLFFVLFTVTACGKNNSLEEISKGKINKEEKNMDSNKIKLTVGHKVFTATLTDNSSTKALLELLEKGNISIDMQDYANMEKVGSLGTLLPRNDKHIITSAGDLILYQGNLFVIYYNPNTYSFTRLGKIDNTTRQELLSVLGSNDVTVILSKN